MLHLVIGPCCSGKSTYIATRLQAEGLSLEHVVFAVAFEGDAVRVRERLEAVGTVYLHLPSGRPPEFQPRRRRLVTQLARLPGPIDAVLLVAERGELACRARRRDSSEPLLNPTHPGSFDAQATAGRVARFDTTAFLPGWVAKLATLGIPHRVLDTAAPTCGGAAAAL